MKILHVAPYSPVPPIFGGALRTYYMLKGFALRHDVTFVTYGTEEDEALLRKEFGDIVNHIKVVRRETLSRPRLFLKFIRSLLSRKSLFFSTDRTKQMKETLDWLCENNGYDAVVFEFPLIARFNLKGDAVKILDEHNVEYNNFRRMYENVRSPLRKIFYLREHVKTYREEINICKKMDAVFVTSSVDGDILDRDVPDKLKYVVPNGVDTQSFAPSDEPIEPYSMVFTGTMDYVPNNDGMIYFLENIFPLIKQKVPQARIYIVGSHPSKALQRMASEDVIVTGYVDDVRPYTARASVYVVPLRMGSGTRLKILEALAMKKAIVTTSIGGEGIELQDGKNAMIGDTPVQFAENVVNLLLDRAKAEQLGAEGYRLAKSRYDWDIIADLANDALNSLVRKKRSDVTPAIYSITNHEKATMNLVKDNGSRSSKPAVKVLVYHRVVDDRDVKNTYSWNVSPSQLHTHLRLLDSWGYSCINFEDYSLYLKGEIRLPKKPIILTFDDGYNDVHLNVLPVLKEFGAKATMFVLGERSIRKNIWDEPRGVVGASLMGDKEIVELHRAGLEIGSHSMTHANLSKLPPEAAWWEIARSKEVLEDLIEAPVVSFAYPFGATDDRLKGMIREAGYEYGCGVFSGPPKFPGDLLDIRRISIKSSSSIFDFALKVLTPYEYYGWVRWMAGERFRVHGSRNGSATESTAVLDREIAADLRR